MSSFGSSKPIRTFQPSLHQCRCTDLDVELVRLVLFCKFIQLAGVIHFLSQGKLNSVHVLT